MVLVLTQKEIKRVTIRPNGNEVEIRPNTRTVNLLLVGGGGNGGASSGSCGGGGGGGGCVLCCAGFSFLGGSSYNIHVGLPSCCYCERDITYVCGSGVELEAPGGYAGFRTRANCACQGNSGSGCLRGGTAGTSGYYGGGGGGGETANGTAGSGYYGRPGGAGLYGYGGGGGGGGFYGRCGTATDGGGYGGSCKCGEAGSATNCGGGGGGAGICRNTTPGCGACGVVDICYEPGTLTATGGNSCYTCDGYCVHRFTSDGTFTIVN